MTGIARAAEYRYFSFTYLWVRLISVWLKACAPDGNMVNGPVQDDPQPDRLRVFFYQTEEELL